MASPRTDATPQAQRAYDILLREIVELEIPPGTPLSENELARRVGASRTPIREAIRRLSHEGLVQIVPGRGAFVSEISLGDIVELFEMREALEVTAASLAARCPDRSVLKPFEDEFLGYVGPMDGTSSAAYYELIARMDEAVLGLCGNRRLARALAENWSEMRRIRHLASGDPARLAQSVHEHLAILQAIVAGDERRTAECVRAHVRASAESTFHRVSVTGGAIRRLMAIRGTT